VDCAGETDDRLDAAPLEDDAPLEADVPLDAEVPELAAVRRRW
jgi:hypothetical protein